MAPRSRPEAPAALPRKDAVMQLLATHRRPMHANEIATRLGVAAGSYGGLLRMLDDLSFDGGLVPMSGQRFRLSGEQLQQHGAQLEGPLNVNPRGFGFVPGVGAEDVFIPAESM